MSKGLLLYLKVAHHGGAVDDAVKTTSPIVVQLVPKGPSVMRMIGINESTVSPDVAVS